MTTCTRWAGVTALAVFVDLATKWLTALLNNDVGILRPRTNPELALGAFSFDSPPWQLALLGIAVVALLSHAIVLSRTNRLSWLALSLVVAGAGANALDRLVTGAVHDWLWLGPVIANIADIWLVAGLVMYVVAAWRDADADAVTHPDVAQPESSPVSA